METERLVLLPRGKLIVASDFHGNWTGYSLVRKRFLQSKACWLIAGDILDRGPDSERILRDVMDLRERFPERFWLLMGNHEAGYAGVLAHSPRNFGFEMQVRYGRMPREYPEFLERLPLVARCRNLLFVHAGASRPVKSLDDLARATLGQRKMVTGLVWNDPGPSIAGWEPNKQRAGSLEAARLLGIDRYGQRALKCFLKRVCCEFLITGHGHCTNPDVLPGQLMLSSSWVAAAKSQAEARKVYLELDLSRRYSKSELKRALRPI